MTEQAEDYMSRWGITYNPKTDFYEIGNRQLDEDEIEALAKYDLDADTEINVLAMDSGDSLDYLDGFDNGLHNMYYNIHAILRKTTGMTDEMLKDITTKLSILEMDYTFLYEAVKKEILNKMECHEASKHFEDYMNPPQESRVPDELPDKQIENKTLEECRELHSTERKLECPVCSNFLNCYPNKGDYQWINSHV